MRALLTLLAATTVSCASGSAAVSNAVANSAIALMSVGASRAMGGCYASCPAGSRCNKETGFCDELPCRGGCGTGQVCDEAPNGRSQCVSTRALDFGFARPSDASADGEP